MRPTNLGSVCAAVLVVLCAAAARPAGSRPIRQGQSADATARRQLESGRAFLRDGRVAEALKDFESIVQLFPSSDVADDALLGIAQLQLDTYGDAAMARATLEQLMTKYPSGTAAPMAFVLLGRVRLAEASTPAAVDAALASFDRVRRLFPESDAVPAASFYAGEAYRGTRRFGEALVRYQRVMAESPASLWSVRARLASAKCLVHMGRPREAMAELQRLRTMFPDTAEAARALTWNTTLYRLFVRPPAQPPFTLTNRPMAGSSAARIKDVRGLALDPSDRLYIVMDDAVRVLGPGGNDVAGFAARDARAVAFSRAGAPIVLLKHGLLRPDGSAAGLSVRRAEGAPRLLESLEAIVALRSGEMLVADRDSGAVLRVDAQFVVQGPFASARPGRLAATSDGEIAMLERETKTVTVVSRDGGPVFRLAEKGSGYRFDNPVDAGFDSLGFLYVLDRGLGAVHVFDPAGKFVVSFSLPENAPGAFRRASAIAVDAAGRLLIADERATGILVFQ